MTDGSAPYLFISHHSSKLDVALELEKFLARHDVKCWLAPRDVEPSESFDMAIKRAIDESCGILLLFCSKSDKSPHVKRELILADSSRKAIIPLRLEDLDPDELAYHLANSQWIDWLEQRDSTIERVAAKARQLSGSPSKTMSVDELIERSGNRDAPPGDPAPSMAPPTRPGTGGKVNWTMIVAFSALVVAMFAAFLFWTNRAPESPLEESTPPDIAEPAPSDVEADDGTETEQVAIETPVEIETPPVQRTPKPSFDCAKASFRIEFLICDSFELSDLDRALASAYQRAKRAAGANQRLLELEQRAWRIENRDVCADTACVSLSIKERLARLREIAARGYRPEGEDPRRPVSGPENLVREVGG